MKPEIKLIILDGYGIILSRGYPDTVDYLSKKYNLNKKRLHDVLYKKYFNLAAERRITQKDAWKKAVTELKLPMTWQEVRELHMGLFKVNQPVMKLIARLRKDYRVIMLSKNTRSQFADTKKLFPEAWKNVDAVINTWELGLPKASKRTILEICRRFRVKPSEVVYADDQRDNLIEPKKLGVKTVYYKSFKQFKEDIIRNL